MKKSSSRPRAGQLRRGMLVGALVLMAWCGHARAAVTGTMTTGQPRNNGTVTVEVVQANANIKYTATAMINAKDTPAQKAEKIAAALNKAFNDGLNLFDATVAGNVITITQQGGGGFTISIPAGGDKTGEAGTLMIDLGGGNGQNWFWRFVRWAVSSKAVVPNGTVLAMRIASPQGKVASASVTGDGVTTANALQTEITKQLNAQGFKFTRTTDPVTGKPGLGSRYLEWSGRASSAGVTVSQGWSTYLGGSGITGCLSTEPC